MMALFSTLHEQAKHMILNICLFSTLLIFSLLTLISSVEENTFVCISLVAPLSFLHIPEVFPDLVLACSSFIELLWLKSVFLFLYLDLGRQQDRCAL